ncbi:hypothetical protein C8F04DRAFT_269802 [Mycena alexandri]|uniref:Uncharacterized protein n=1 Tax=Mycena alexandri TaxID=1745969 RepID=A0AAD6WRX3_9AGAR|nr:hypothetical protein C8F04DRAFT_269802 [Mycena alexandri]
MPCIRAARIALGRVGFRAVRPHHSKGWPARGTREQQRQGPGAGLARSAAVASDALPVNLRFCFDGMEENESEGLDELVEKERDGWFKGVDCMCISDNYWLNTCTGALTYGLRGPVYFKINVFGPGRDLHFGPSCLLFPNTNILILHCTGVFGCTVHEPMTDLISLMSHLVDAQGNILVPGVDQTVGVADVAERTTSENRQQHRRHRCQDTRRRRRGKG